MVFFAPFVFVWNRKGEPTEVTERPCQPQRLFIHPLRSLQSVRIEIDLFGLLDEQ